MLGHQQFPPQNWVNISDLTSGYCWARVGCVGPALDSLALEIFTEQLGPLQRLAGRGSGVVVKAACFESQRSQVQSPLWSSSFKETKCFFPAHAWRFWASVAEKYRARPQTARARISNPVSGRAVPSHYLTILSRLSWLSSAYICTKGLRWLKIPSFSFHFTVQQCTE